MNLGLCQKCDLVHRANELSQSLEDKYKSYGITETIEDHQGNLSFGTIINLSPTTGVVNINRKPFTLPPLPKQGPVPSNMNEFLKAKPNNYKGKRKK